MDGSNNESKDKPSPPDYPEKIHARILSWCERNYIYLRVGIMSRMLPAFGQEGICRFGRRSVIKFSKIGSAEAANIEYIARNTTIPVPRIQDVIVIKGDTYTIMDYIDGTELENVWWDLYAEQHRGIFEDLKNYISQMRSLRPPNPGRVECADGTGIYDPRLPCSPYPPFPSVKDFHDELGHRYVLNVEAHREAWPQFQAIKERNYQTKFTHSDIAPRNILVKNGKIAAIVDWETAGWYPEYWEYTRWEDSNYNSDKAWHDAREEIMDRYPDELWAEHYLGGVFIRL
ncbi:kinase-like protein [Rickenella mellea]|uniref:Kinase-like protein n=1 Tax=Rickenella mellea TaxID=50990 RepID=A0A4Y7QKY6_9AGAM|nr:kinase-like protein [Rickenella mellea]